MGHLLHKQALWGGGGWGISCIERASRLYGEGGGGWGISCIERYYGEGVGGASPALRGIMGRGGWGISCIERYYGEGVGGASPALRGIMGRGWVGHLLH